MALAGKNAVVFGGAGGIGLEIVKHLLQEGISKVYVLDICELSSEAREQVREHTERADIYYGKCDIADSVSLEKTLRVDVIGAMRFVDILVNSAGIADESMPSKLIAVNLTGVIESSLLGLQLMSVAEGGRGGTIVNIASIAGLEAIPFLPVYCASKFGVLGFTRSCGIVAKIGDTQVKLIAVCPGATQSKLFTSTTQRKPSGETSRALQEHLERYPAQSAEVVGECVIRAVLEGESGSVWVCQNGQITQEQFTQKYS